MPSAPVTRVAEWKSLRGRAIELLMREDIEASNAPVSAEILRGLGFEARVAVERDVNLSADRIVFVGGNPRWYRRMFERIDALRPSVRPDVIIWQTEALPLPSASGFPPEPLTVREIAKIVLRDRRVNDHYSNARYFRRLARRHLAGTLAVASRAYQAYLAQEGIASDFVPVGYHPDYGDLLELERDIDVLFLGERRVPRRRRIIRRLRREGIDVLALGSTSLERGYWGEARTELLNRTKVLLNLPRYPGHLSDRIVMGMATGALVVSEPLYLPDPFEPGVHYVECATDDLAATVRKYRADEDARRRITETAHAFVTQGLLTLEGAFVRLLDLADAHLRA